MAIEYLYNGSSAPITAVEKIKIVMADRRVRTNPFLVIRNTPDHSEALRDGGGRYVFKQMLGLNPASRRTTLPVNNQVDYGNNLNLVDKELTVAQPLEPAEGKVIPTSKADIVQMDGINLAMLPAAKIAKILVDGETTTDVALFKNASAARKKTYIKGGTPTDMRETVHNAIADYFDVSKANGWDDEATKYFDAKTYGYERNEIKVFMNPVDVSLMSWDFNKSGGTTGDLVYTALKEGQVRLINGVEIIETRYVPKGESWIVPIGVIGAPDTSVIFTQIMTKEAPKGELFTYGKHYYDSVLLFEELITIVSEAPSLKKGKDKEGKEGKKDKGVGEKI